MSMRVIDIKAWSISKYQQHADDNEDAFGYNDAKNTFVVCDGATRSFASKKWARTLVDNYVKAPYLSRDSLKKVQKKYEESFDQSNWYATEWDAYLEGSFSTVLGVLYSSESNAILLQSIGDTIAFVFSKNEIVHQFPKLNSDDIDEAPFLLSSRDDKNYTDDGEHVIDRLENLSMFDVSEYQDITLYLLTDQIANWLMRDLRRRQMLLYSLQTEDHFRFLGRKIIHPRFKQKDDLTMIRVVFSR